MLYFYVLISLITVSFIAGPGFGLAGAMATWYLIKYRQDVFRRWPRFASLQPAVFGFLIVLAILIVSGGFIIGLGKLVQSAMGPGKF